MAILELSLIPIRIKANIRSSVVRISPRLGIISSPSRNRELNSFLLIYDIKTLGWTTSAEINPFKGFHLHALFTYQKPTYNNYFIKSPFEGVPDLNANLTNALYFNGRWETFGGVNWKVNKHLSLGATVVNFLNQKGASGTINGAELLSKEEAGKFKDHYMSGNYLRPLTLEFSASLSF